VVDPVEEFRQVDVHDISEPGLHVLAGLSDGHVRRPSRPEPVAALRERVFPERRERLRRGLLDQPVERRRNPQQADAAAFLGDFRPAHGHRLMRAVKQVAFDLLPVFQQIPAKLRGLHPVHTGRTLVALHPFQGFEHVLPPTDRLHEPVFPCRTFGGPGRYEFIAGLVGMAVGLPFEVQPHLHCLHTVLPLTLSFALCGPFGPPTVRAFGAGYAARPICLLRLSALECLTSLA